MTHKQIIKEGIFILGSFILSILIFSIATTKQSIYISDIFVGTHNIEGNWYDFLINLNFLAGIIFFFPVLFSINTIRVFYHRFNLKYLTVFHLFITFISLIISLLMAAFIKQMAMVFSNSMTLYPPLSAIPEEGLNTYYLSQWTYFAYCFCLLQLMVFISTIVKISREHQSKICFILNIRSPPICRNRTFIWAWHT
jgi:hypothetical protein